MGLQSSAKTKSSSARQHRRGARVIILGAAFVLLGAGINVAIAVAVAIAYWRGVHVGRLVADDSVLSRSYVDHVWRHYAGEDWPDSAHPPEWGRVEIFSLRSAVCARSTIAIGPVFDFASTRSEWWKIELLQTGWPLRSLRCASISSYETAPEARSAGVWFIGATPIPIEPEWCGALANTLFFTALLWLLFRGPVLTRRRIRRRRGQCIWCGYPLRERRVCSECGRAVVFRNQVTG